MKIHKTIHAYSTNELDNLITVALSDGWEYAGGTTVVPIYAVSAGVSSEINSGRKGVQANVNGFEYSLIWAQGMFKEIKEN